MTDSLNDRIDVLDAAIRLYQPSLRSARTNAGEILAAYEAAIVAMGDASARKDEEVGVSAATVPETLGTSSVISREISDTEVLEHSYYSAYERAEYWKGQALQHLDAIEKMQAHIDSLTVQHMHGASKPVSSVEIRDNDSLQEILQSELHTAGIITGYNYAAKAWELIEKIRPYLRRAEPVSSGEISVSEDEEVLVMARSYYKILNSNFIRKESTFDDLSESDKNRLSERLRHVLRALKEQPHQHCKHKPVLSDGTINALVNEVIHIATWREPDHKPFTMIKESIQSFLRSAGISYVE